MNKYPNVKLELRGHTDNIGDPAMNLDLSINRSANVMDYLVNKGVDRNRLSSQGHGESLPIESNGTEEGRQKNRRTELRIVSK
jgi:outer membrane protein OmpA-like peptidoglycan-associated protein